MANAYILCVFNSMIIDFKMILRWMLRIYFGVLGIVVTTGGEVKSPKVEGCVVNSCKVCVCV